MLFESQLDTIQRSACDHGSDNWHLRCQQILPGRVRYPRCWSGAWYIYIRQFATRQRRSEEVKALAVTATVLGWYNSRIKDACERPTAQRAEHNLVMRQSSFMRRYSSAWRERGIIQVSGYLRWETARTIFS